LKACIGELVVEREIRVGGGGGGRCSSSRLGGCLFVCLAGFLSCSMLLVYREKGVED